MSEPNNSAWPFTEITESEGFDIDKIFGTGNGAAQADPFAAPAPVPAAEPAPAPVAQEVPTAPIADPTPAPAAVTTAPEAKAPAPAKAAAEAPAENPIAAAFEQKWSWVCTIVFVVSHPFCRNGEKTLVSVQQMRCTEQRDPANYCYNSSNFFAILTYFTDNLSF